MAIKKNHFETMASKGLASKIKKYYDSGNFNITCKI